MKTRRFVGYFLIFLKILYSTPEKKKKPGCFVLAREDWRTKKQELHRILHIHNRFIYSTSFKLLDQTSIGMLITCHLNSAHIVSVSNHSHFNLFDVDLEGFMSNPYISPKFRLLISTNSLHLWISIASMVNLYKPPCASIFYRPIRPSDLQLLEKLHADLFPIRLLLLISLLTSVLKYRLSLFFTNFWVLWPAS